MTRVKLMGEMGEKFGSEWNCVDNSIRDILKLIDCQTEGFKDYLAECHMKNIGFSIQTGETLIEEFPELYMNLARDEVIITPVPAGSGKGLGKLITGLLILAAMFFMPGMAGFFTATGTSGTAAAGGLAAGTTATGGAAAGVSALQGMSAFQMAQAGYAIGLSGFSGAAVMMLGANLALMGLTEMTAPDPDGTTNDPSYLFNGAENHIEQGQPVPLLYGELTIGGSPIYQGYTPGTKVGQGNGAYSYTGQGTYAGTGSYSAGNQNYDGSNGYIGSGTTTWQNIHDWMNPLNQTNSIIPVIGKITDAELV